MSQGDVRSQLAYGLESVRLAEQAGDPVLTGALHDNVIGAHAVLGRLAAVQQGYAKAVALLGDDPTAGIDLHGISPFLSVTQIWLYTLVLMGRFGEAERGLTRGREVARAREAS